MFEVQEALDAQKEEFARREDAFRRREETLRKQVGWRAAGGEGVGKRGGKGVELGGYNCCVYGGWGRKGRGRSVEENFRKERNTLARRPRAPARRHPVLHFSSSPTPTPLLSLTRTSSCKNL